MSVRKIQARTSASNQSYLDFWDRAVDEITKAHCESIVKRARDRIQANVSGRKVAMAWSGGKDSILLDYIASPFVVKNVVYACTNLEYPAFDKWVASNKPANTTEMNMGHDLAFLATHPDWLFPKEDGKRAYRWYSTIQVAAQTKFLNQSGCNCLLTGRRTKDNNNCGKGGVRDRGDGMRIVSPMFDFSHEEVMACLRHFSLSLPPIYSWQNGWTEGTHPWPARYYPLTDEQGFAEVWAIDSGIIRGAALVLPAARRWLEETGNG